MISEHQFYLDPGNTTEDRCIAYKELFKSIVHDKALDETRSATNKAWVPGSVYFIKQVQEQIYRQVMSKTEGTIDGRRHFYQKLIESVLVEFLKKKPSLRAVAWQSLLDDRAICRRLLRSSQ